MRIKPRTAGVRGRQVTSTLRKLGVIGRVRADAAERAALLGGEPD